MLGVDEERPPPVTVVVIFLEQSDTAPFAPVDPFKPLLDARDLDWVRRERRALHHDLVARRDLRLPVAAVERLGPDQCRRLGRAPFEVAWTGRHAVDGNVLRDRQFCEWRHRTGAVPYLDVMRKAAIRHRIRVRLADRSHEDVLAIGRETHLSQHRARADASDCAARDVDECELARAVILEECGVSLISQRVTRLIGAELPAPARLLNPRPLGSALCCGRGADSVGNHLHEEGLAVGRPLQRAAEHRVEPHVAEPARFPITTTGPELHGIGGGVSEGEGCAIGCPQESVGAAAGRQCDLRLAARCDIDDGERLRARRDAISSLRVVLAPRARLDANAGEFQKWLRHLTDRRVLNVRHEKSARARRAKHRPRRRRRVQNIEHVLRRLVVTGSGRHRNRGGRQKSRRREREEFSRRHAGIIYRMASGVVWHFNLI